MLHWSEIDNLGILKKHRRYRGNPGGRKVLYADCVAAFDIESSTVYDENGEPHSFMYIWMFALDDVVYYGRTWDEFRDFVFRLKDHLREGMTLLAYVHNLSYEYQFLSGIFEIDRDDIFPTDPRKILKLTLVPWLEMRCSYYLTNMSLRQFLKAEDVEMQKEELDYKKLRYPWTEMSEEELSYCNNDVQGLTQAIRHRLKMTKDNLYTIPYTSTGYVRREAKRVLKTCRRHDDYRYDSWEVFKRLAKAFRGGNTHANRYYAALGVIREKGFSEDFASCYPTEIVLDEREYPDRQFFVEPPELLADDSIAHLEDLISTHRAVLFTVALWDVKVDDDQPVPYIPMDKCDYVQRAGMDNGRILYAEKVEITITDVDWRIVKGMYTWSRAEVTWLAYSGYRPLPEPYKDLVRTYFTRKTELKGGDAYMYGRSKELLNSLYG